MRPRNKEGRAITVRRYPKRRVAFKPVYNERQKRLQNYCGFLLQGSKSRAKAYVRKAKENLKKFHILKENSDSKITSTPLVRKWLETLFSKQMNSEKEDARSESCGVCEGCQRTHCGQCRSCRQMAKFGGRGDSRKECKRRKCLNRADPVEHRASCEASESEDEGDWQPTEEGVPVNLTETTLKRFKWLGEPINMDEDSTYYERVEIEGSQYRIGDYVMLESAKPNIPALVSRITYMWKGNRSPGMGYIHAEVLMRASDTVLGGAGKPRELFLVDRCCHGIPLTSILRPASVKKEPTLDYDSWSKRDLKTDDNKTCDDDDGKTYYYQKFYDRFSAKFEDLPDDPVCPNNLRRHRFCPSCQRLSERESEMIPVVINKLADKCAFTEPKITEWSSVKYRGCDYKKGSAVFLKAGTFKFDVVSPEFNKVKLRRMDENIYTEYYRKSVCNTSGSNIDTMEPFCVGYVVAVFTRGGQGPLVNPLDIYLKVHVLYRPENTNNRFPQREDLNLLHWSERVQDVHIKKVTGPCHLFYVKNIPQKNREKWSEENPSRFYFKDAYDEPNERFVKAPLQALAIGESLSINDKVKENSFYKVKNESNSRGERIKPLNTLDVFSGCGGLSLGLQQAGVADCKWAIDNDKAAIDAFELNHKHCTVFNEDCNVLLKAVMKGATHSKDGQRLPLRGEVELMCGGPPCQGYSGINRFSSNDESKFKNCLVATYLSYCDYYRPKYFILENVRNFVEYKKGMILKLTLRCLLDMGYQCTFAIVQAGSYGVPQTRRRLIVFASAPGFKLPFFPEPSYVFSKRALRLTVSIDGKRFGSNLFWNEGAPRRTCTVLDAMSDLPSIENGADNLEIEYEKMPQSHYQRVLRTNNEMLTDHICKKVPPISEERIKRIPIMPGADWRDLPNIKVTLSDGTQTQVLEYRHEDKKNGRSGNGALRGVCACAAAGGGPGCRHNADRPDNTLIPWWMPHTANRNNNFAGMFGRLTWDGYFSTTITDPEPTGKQGRVLHPEEHRVVSVRECARSQGFPDSYLFSGTLQEKHRQIGNAVPPPLAAALGRQILKALNQR